MANKQQSTAATACGLAAPPGKLDDRYAPWLHARPVALTQRFLGCFGILYTSLACQPANGRDASGCERESGSLVTTTQAIYGGTPGCSELGSAVSAVGYVIVTKHNEQGLTDTCSLTRIGPGVAVTAKHCFKYEDYNAAVGFAPMVGHDSNCEELAGELEVKRVTLHPSADLALVQFDETAPQPSLDVAGTNPVLGTSVVLAGYGVNESGDWGVLRCAASSLVATDPMLATASTAGERGACSGDSGGPLLQLDSAGTPRILGVLHGGSASCTGTDLYTTLAPHREFLSQ